MDKTIYINYKGLDLECIGHFTNEQSGDYYQPSEPASFHLETVIYEGVDITPLMDAMNFDFSIIEEKCLDKIID